MTRSIRGEFATGGIVPRGAVTVVINPGYVVPPSYFDNPAIRVEITRGS